MGLRHRTPMSALREQRRSAEQGLPRSPAMAAPSFPRRASRIRLSAIEPGSESSRLTWSVGPNDLLPISEKCQKLLTRLRSSLQPQDEAERLESQVVSSEYRSIQDELARLAQHYSQKRMACEPETPETESWRELLIPLSFHRQEAADELPYRSLKIDAGSDRTFPQIRALERSPDDLRYLQEPQAPVTPVPGTILTLVPKLPHPVQNAKASLLIDDPQADPEIGAEAANLMQQNLHFARIVTTVVNIPSDVIMSLLDD